MYNKYDLRHKSFEKQCFKMAFILDILDNIKPKIRIYSTALIIDNYLYLLLV